jgi:hypothetical protein
MKITPLLKKVILEQSRIELLFDALTKPSKDKEGNIIKPKLNKDEFTILVNADPTTRTNNVNMLTADSKELGKVKAGKYVQWLIKNYLSPKTERQPGDYGYEKEVKRVKDLFMEDLFKVTQDLIKFERFKNRLPKEMRDINKLTPSSLYDAVKDFDLTIASTSKSERKSAEVHPGAELVYEGNKWRVVRIKDNTPLGKEAACFYGDNMIETRWCTSAPGLSYFENTYIPKGPLYVIYDPNDTNIMGKSGLPKERYQFHFQENQFMDKDDRQIDLVKYLNGPMAELKDFFKPEFAKGLMVNGKKLIIDGFSTGAVGKFIGLYGLDDLIETLPDTLTELQIQNRDKNNIIITIPDSIGRFKKLKLMILENCIDSITDSICQLTNLEFLSLVNNDKLKTIPECVVDLPNLAFINLKGSQNVQLPKAVEERAESMGLGLWNMGKI